MNHTTDDAATSVRANGVGAPPPPRDALAIFEHLSRIGAKAAAQRTAEAVVQSVTDDATALLGAQCGAFFYSGGRPAGEMSFAVSGVAVDAFADFSPPADVDRFVATFAGDGIVRVGDLGRAPRRGVFEGRAPVRSYLVAPITSLEGEVLGGLFFGHAEPEAFDATTERAVGALAQLAGSALANVRLIAKLTKSDLALRESEARYRLVVEATQEGVWFWDVATNTVTWNDRLLELMGVTRAEWGGTFDDWFARLHPDDQPRLGAALKAHLERREPYQIERFRLRHSSGEYRWCTTLGQAEWDEDGRPLRMAGSFRDITEQERAHEALRSSEHRYVQILDSVQDMIFTKNERLELVWANAATRAFYGLAAEEVRGVAGLPGERIGVTNASLQDDRAVFGSGQVVERPEEPRTTPSGETRTFHTVKSPISDTEGRVVELVAVSRDVTERKRELDAQKLLARASAILGASIDYEKTLANVARATVPTFADWSAVDVLDADGNLQRLAVEHTDKDKVRLAQELHRKYPTDMSSSYGVPNVLRTGVSELVPVVPQELLMSSAVDDEHRALLLGLALESYIVVPLIILGRPIGAITFVTAESKRRYGEQDLAFAEELARRASVAIDQANLYRKVTDLAVTLEKRVEQRTAALVEANKELEAFSYTVSHDLRAPIRHIGGFVDLLRATSGASLDEKGTRYLDTIKTAATQMGALIDGLLAFSRLGRAELAKRTVDLAELVHGIVRELEPDLTDRAVVWSIGALPVVQGDPTMLRLVLANFINNAVKYTRPRPEAHVEVGARRDADEVVVWVKDDGVGFNMEYVGKLFGVFQRLHGDVQFEGTGIGLATARRIIHRHGGRTWAEGSPDAGATFFFSVPLQEPKS